MTMQQMTANSSIDILNVDECRSFLSADVHDMHICLYDSIDSTNTQAKRLLKLDEIHSNDPNTHSCPLLALVLAEEQTAGRGQHGNSFFSPRQTGLYMSIIMDLHDDSLDATRMTINAAVATHRAINTLCHVDAQIKWVNDIYLDGKKIAGILAESTSNMLTGRIEQVIIGIGVNIYLPDNLPANLADKLGALQPSQAVLHHNAVSRNELAAAITNEFFNCLQDTPARVLGEYRASSCVLGRQISYETDGRTCTGKAIEIDSQGNLHICNEAGLITVLNSGGISLIV